jgi:hypothetical protein
MLPDNHLAGLAAMLDFDALDDPSRPDPFVREIYEPVKHEIERRRLGLATSAATVKIVTISELDPRLLPVLSKLYESVATLFKRHAHLSTYPAAVAEMLRRERAYRNGHELH